MKQSLRKKMILLIILPTLLFGMIVIGSMLTAARSSSVSELKNAFKGTAAVSAVLMVICIIFAILVSGSITKSLRESIYLLQAIANGELDVNVNESLMQKKDESGDISRSLHLLQGELRNIVEKVSVHIDEIRMASEMLDMTADETMGTMQEVSESVTAIAGTASEQSQNSQNASASVAAISDSIEHTLAEVTLLTQTTDFMKESGETAAKKMQTLREINDDVQKSVRLITTQTSQTNISVQKIQDTAFMIADIAQETNLLSLNASIEAARAGERGRGFAVVAEQIQKLAEQSNQSSSEMEHVIAALIGNAQETVTTMQHMQEIVDSQNQTLLHVEQSIHTLAENIATSVESISRIGETAKSLTDSKKDMIQTVEDLSESAQSSEQATNETSMAAYEVTASFSQVANYAERLKEIAEEMADCLCHFQILS